MQITTRGRYGVMAMAELAMRGAAAPGVSVHVADIASCQQLSVSYLEQLFAGLRRAGLVVSVRGPGGGYRLARPPHEVTIAQVLAAVAEPVRMTRCDGLRPGCLNGPDAMPMRCRTHDLWEAMGRHLDLFLAAVTLADVIAGDLCAFSRAPEPIETQSRDLVEAER